MAISLARDFRIDLNSVSVPIVIETLLYRSSKEEVLISFDFVICNNSSRPVDIFLTHLDDVKAWLATIDWMNASEKDCDERVALVKEVYGDGIRFDADECLFYFSDPITLNDDSAFANPLVKARALIYGADDLQQKCLVPSPLGICERDRFKTRGRFVNRLEAYPVIAKSSLPNIAPRMFSSFRLSGIPTTRDAGCAFVRVTLKIANGAYERLVQPQVGAAFSVRSSRRVHEQIEQRFEMFTDHQLQRTLDFGTFYSFYQDEIKDAVIDPVKYQIIIGQPDPKSEDKCVRFRPASGSLSERYVADPHARQRALWFNSWSPDFALVLAYSDARRTESFRQRLTADVSPW